MKRVLFVAEDVSLAQVVRLVVLARSLDPARHDVHFACRSFDPLVFRPGEFTRWGLYTLDRAVVHRALARGKRMYDLATLRRYARDDREVLQAVRPDLVVGDLRLSLCASAPAAGVPLATLINAYWSPYAVRATFPLPDHPILRVVGEKMATRYVSRALPRAFAHFAAPVNELREEHGLPPVGSLLEVLTHGDHTLYPDIPLLTPTRDLPASHRYLGPVLWSPDVPLPAWWQTIPDDRPLIYVTFGSSGRVRALPRVIEALAGLRVSAAVATAGRITLRDLPPGVHAAAFVPGHEVARRAALVICNGGSTTGYQALAQGTPVVGIASNLDQHLAMAAMEAQGVGVGLRAMSVRAVDLRAAVLRVMGTPSYRERARAVAAEMARWDAAGRFGRFVDEVTGAAARAPHEERGDGS